MHYKETRKCGALRMTHYEITWHTTIIWDILQKLMVHYKKTAFFSHENG